MNKTKETKKERAKERKKEKKKKEKDCYLAQVGQMSTE